MVNILERAKACSYVRKSEGKNRSFGNLWTTWPTQSEIETDVARRITRTWFIFSDDIARLSRATYPLRDELRSLNEREKIRVGEGWLIESVTFNRWSGQVRLATRYRTSAFRTAGARGAA